MHHAFLASPVQHCCLKEWLVILLYILNIGNDTSPASVLVASPNSTPFVFSQWCILSPCTCTCASQPLELGRSIPAPVRHIKSGLVSEQHLYILRIDKPVK